ncbi:hypothetical protein J2739_004653 [Variovorax soli]|uniref:CcoQ/FixQ family Cbb3-type cytochrome c oxidase assembly chaperone n=1 Tax=Variovorax soli TaxID=376815 RepID=A0ABU1NLH3_9BURK|nr:hypothetical protein [Variovorax soli]
MDGLFTEFLIWKAIGLCVLAFFVSFFYRLITGRSIAEARSEKEEG